MAQQVVFLVLLTRLLAPEDYGIFGMVFVFLGFAALLGDQTVGPALAQRPEIRAAHLDSVFWYGLLLGGTLSAAFFVLAPVIADFYQVPALVPFARVLSGLFVVNSLSVVPRAILQRRVAVDRLARVDVAAATVGGTLAVAMAAWNWGAWSLVGQYAAVGLVTASWLWWSAGWVPGTEVRWRAFRELLPYAGNLLGSNVLDYWARNTDTLLVGRLVGSVGLGLYSRAYTVVFMPIVVLNMLLGKVLFPTLCAVQANIPRAREVYLRASGFFLLVAAPMMLGLYVTAPDLVPVLFGRQWMGIVVVLRILALAAVIQAFYLPAALIYSSQGRADLLLRWGMRNAIVLVLGISAGAAVGSVMSVALGFLVANLLVVVPALRGPGRLISITPADVARATAGACGCAVAMAAAAWGVRALLPAGSPEWLRLVAAIPTGGAVYAVLLARFRVRAFADFLRVLIGERRSGVLLGALSFSRRRSGGATPAPPAGGDAGAAPGPGSL